ncbi:MAG: T9SS type A sorting domain-containing protein [Muribaculaceae bacterium]|nr:T9SS type A sorting domain-containing protein [Muribaculaceae bacterium]
MTAKLVISVQKPIFVPSNNNYIRQSINATEVDENNAYIYGVIPSVGVWRYPVVATPMEVSVECEISDVCNERQDAIVSWTAAQSATAYKVYYQSTYTNGQGETITTDWAEVGETSTTSIAHENVCWATVLENDDRKYYERSYKYKVVPVYASGALGTETVSSSITPEFIPSSPVWVEVNPVKDYEGYCIVQLLWKEWHGYGCQPHHYNVIRDGKAINLRENETLEIGGSNYVDTTCISGVIYNYHIEAAYPGVDIPDEYSNHLTNEDREVEIAIRDWSKPRYSISKIYEYKIVDREYESEKYPGYDGVVKPDATEFPNFYTEPDCYRQGVFYNGCWYIAQYTNDNTVDKFQHNPQLTSTTLKGGILRFLGEDPRKEIPDDKVNYPSAYPQENNVVVDNPIERRPLVSYHRENQCIAVDESGTFLTRGLRTGWSWNENSWEDNNNYALACSSVEFHNFDKNWHGSFDLPASLVAELEASAVAESMRAEDPTLPGRVDYFSAQGDLYNDDWCYLYMAPMVSKTVFRVKLVKSENTVYVPEGNWIKFTEDKNAEFDYADENYAFPVNCENREGEQFVYEQLTNVYSLYSGTNTDPSQKGKNIYETSTFVNTIGGTTFEFNNELFLVAPQGQYPGNTGSFLVGMANRFEKDENNKWVNVGAANADMTNIIPTAQWYTGKANTDATETNGLWIYGEQAKDADGNKIDENKDGMTDYAYIYTYRPGVMFGKYILTPTTQFPPSQVILSIDPLYKTDKETDNGTDILRYDATASWKDVENYATSGGNFYEIEGYTFSLYDVEKRDGNEGGEIINVTFNMTGLNPDGTITDNKGNIVEGLTYTPYTMVENGVEKTYYEYTYVKEDVDAVDDNCEKRDFIAYVTVNYKGLPGQSTEGLSFNSAQTEYIDANAYVPELPQATTTIYKETYIVPKDTDGDNKPDTDFQFYYFYMDMVEPESEDPVTNYTITVDKGNGEVETLDKFYLYDPEGTTGLTPNKDGYVEITAEYDENGNLITPAAIPGTYDFDAARKAIAEKNDAENTTHQQIIKWQVGDIVGPDDTDGDNSPIKGDEAKWKITVNAHYANTNAKISYSTNGGETLYYKDGTLTGVESPMCSSDISVYPNPAESYIIVKSPSVIGKLSIYAADGREMRTIDVDDTSVQINVENLSKGIYVIKVNGITKKFSKK